MKKYLKYLITTLLLTATLDLTTHAAEITPTNQVLTTNANAEILATADANAPVVVSKEALPDGAPVQVTGVTDNGFYQIELNGTYFVAQNGLDDSNTASTVTPAGGKYTCVIDETDEYFKQQIGWNGIQRKDWTNDPLYISFRDQLETAYNNKQFDDFNCINLKWVGYAANIKEITANLTIDMLKTHPEMQNDESDCAVRHYWGNLSDEYYDDGTRECTVTITLCVKPLYPDSKWLPL